MAERLGQDSNIALEDDEEPLLTIEAPFLEVTAGEDDTFRTENASNDDWERRSIIQRTRGPIHTRVDLMEVRHGTSEGHDCGEEATIMVLRFRFDSQKNSRRVIRARINVEFFPASKSSDAPVVEAIALEGRWSVKATRDHETTKKGGQLKLGASGVPFVEAGGSATFEKTVSRDISDATTVTGCTNLGTGSNKGDSTVAVWTLQENKRRGSGVPDTVKVALRLRRQDCEPFNAKVTLEAKADFISGVQQMMVRLPLDDPVLFNPKLTAQKPKPGRFYMVENLASVDLDSLSQVRMDVAWEQDSRQATAH